MNTSQFQKFIFWIISYLLTHQPYSVDGNSLSIGIDKPQDSIKQFSGRLFESNEILRLKVLSDFTSIMNDRGEDRSYHKGLLYYVIEDDTVNRKIKLRTRGNFRRNPTNCKYPPITVKFGKLTTAKDIFSDQTKLKLVTQCQLETYVLLEYISYRIYNLLNEYSYRVRLSHITYADLQTGKEYFTRYAFFIEHDKKMAERIKAEIYKPNVVQYFLQRKNVITMALFQYLIGNSDWYVTSKHNMSILEVTDNGDLIAVPYDFDWSRLVNAAYTKPEGVPDDLLQERRIYKGLCIYENELEDQIKLFNSRKQEILNLVTSTSGLSKQSKKQTLKYIESFYKIINNPSSLSRIFQKEKCIADPNIGDQ